MVRKRVVERGVEEKLERGGEVWRGRVAETSQRRGGQRGEAACEKLLQQRVRETGDF